MRKKKRKKNGENIINIWNEPQSLKKFSNKLFKGPYSFHVNIKQHKAKSRFT